MIQVIIVGTGALCALMLVFCAVFILISKELQQLGGAFCNGLKGLVSHFVDTTTPKVEEWAGAVWLKVEDATQRALPKVEEITWKTFNATVTRLDEISSARIEQICRGNRIKDTCIGRFCDGAVVMAYIGNDKKKKHQFLK